MHVVDDPDCNSALIVTITRTFDIRIYSFNNLELLYDIPRAKGMGKVSEKHYHAFVQGVVLHPDPGYA